MPPRPSSEKTLTVLGSTGSIGRNTLDVAGRFPDRYPIHALAAHTNVELLASQIERHRPAVAVAFDPKAAERLRDLKPNGGHTTVLSGMEGLLEAATDARVDHVVAGIVGAIGMRPAYAAIEAGKEISLANKEALVLAGELMLSRAEETGSRVLPLDSEHNAVFQCLNGHNPLRASAGSPEPGSMGGSRVERIVLTASGGAFRDRPLDTFADITREEALAHPNWAMGPKITVDSATMMNKGLEVIEARWLFGLPPERIGVLVHRQSIVHALVEFVDGSVLAQLGLPDMRTPIACCLAYPERLPMDLPRLNLAEVGRLEFEPVDEARYPVFFLALEALKAGGGRPAALNGANEAVVEAYLAGAFPFTGIAAILKQAMARLDKEAQSGALPPFVARIATVDDAVAADRHGRDLAARLIAESKS